MIAALLGLAVIGGVAGLVWIATKIEWAEGVLLRDEHGPAVVILDGPTAEAHRRAG